MPITTIQAIQGDEEFTFPTATSYGIKDGKLFDVQVHTGDQHTVDRYMWAVFKLPRHRAPAGEVGREGLALSLEIRSRVTIAASRCSCHARSLAQGLWSLGVQRAKDELDIY